MRLPPPAAPDPEAEAALRAARLELGEVPPLLEQLAHAPPILRAAWGLVEATLVQGKLARTTKELIALAATSAAAVPSLADPLRRSLAARGVDEQVLADLAEKAESHRLPDRTRALLVVGRRAALQPALLTDADFAQARRHGLDDPELAELVALGATVAFLIAAARALG